MARSKKNHKFDVLTKDHFMSMSNSWKYIMDENGNRCPLDMSKKIEEMLRERYGKAQKES